MIIWRVPTDGRFGMGWFHGSKKKKKRNWILHRALQHMDLMLCREKFINGRKRVKVLDNGQRIWWTVPSSQCSYSISYCKTFKGYIKKLERDD